MTNLFPTTLPNGNILWYGTALPSLSGDGTFTAGDYFWVTTATGGPGTLYRCTTTGNGATAIFQPVSGESANVTAKTAAYTAVVTDDVILQSGNVAVNLGPAVNFPNKIFTVKTLNTSGGTVVASSGIDGGHTVTLPVQYGAIRLVSDGNQYWAIGQFGSYSIA